MVKDFTPPPFYAFYIRLHYFWTCTILSIRMDSLFNISFKSWLYFLMNIILFLFFFFHLMYYTLKSKLKIQYLFIKNNQIFKLLHVFFVFFTCNEILAKIVIKSFLQGLWNYYTSALLLLFSFITAIECCMICSRNLGNICVGICFL